MEEYHDIQLDLIGNFIGMKVLLLLEYILNKMQKKIEKFKNVEKIDYKRQNITKKGKR